MLTQAQILAILAERRRQDLRQIVEAFDASRQRSAEAIATMCRLRAETIQELVKRK